MHATHKYASLYLNPCGYTETTGTYWLVSVKLAHNLHTIWGQAQQGRRKAWSRLEPRVLFEILSHSFEKSQNMETVRLRLVIKTHMCNLVHLFIVWEKLSCTLTQHYIIDRLQNMTLSNIIDTKRFWSQQQHSYTWMKLIIAGHSNTQ